MALGHRCLRARNRVDHSPYGAVEVGHGVDATVAGRRQGCCQKTLPAIIAERLDEALNSLMVCAEQERRSRSSIPCEDVRSVGQSHQMHPVRRDIRGHLGDRGHGVGGGEERAQDAQRSGGVAIRNSMMSTGNAFDCRQFHAVFLVVSTCLAGPAGSVS